MQKLLAQILGIVVGTLAVFGLFVTDGHLFGFTNADLALDIARLGLAAALLYYGFARSNDSARGILMFTAILYIGMGLLGLVDSKLWGLLPNGLTGFDIAFHLMVGAVTAVVANAGHLEHHSTSNRL